MSVAHQTADDLRSEIERQIDELQEWVEATGGSRYSMLSKADKLRANIDKLISRVEHETESHTRALYEGIDYH